MRLDGRIEKRIPKGIAVYLVSLKKPRTAERVLTENVSPHGARVVTKRHWQPGEDQWITPLSGQFQLPAQVIYCQPLANGDFCVGLDFRGRPVNWEAVLANSFPARSNGTNHKRLPEPFLDHVVFAHADRHIRQPQNQLGGVWSGRIFFARILASLSRHVGLGVGLQWKE
jgi:hypothetical protein